MKGGEIDPTTSIPKSENIYQLIPYRRNGLNNNDQIVKRFDNLNDPIVKINEETISLQLPSEQTNQLDLPGYWSEFSEVTLIVHPSWFPSMMVVVLSSPMRLSLFSNAIFSVYVPLKT